MRAFTFKGLFLTAVFMLLGCLTIQAADDDLITKQITIKLDKAGTLPDRITSSKKYKITNLKIIGEINGTDFRMIREMAGSDYYGGSTEGNLSVLDLSEAKIVIGGGDCFNGYSCYTSNDVIGNRAFSGCSGLTSVTLPAGITEIGECAFYGCSGLTSLTLPAGLTQIDDYAFSECSGLTSMYVYAEKVPKIGEDVFTGCDAKKCTVYVPKGTYDDYWLSDFRNYFENIVEFDATGIDKTTTSTDVKEVSRYSVNGQRLVGPTKGLNIVKYSDGSVKKVAVEIDGSQYLKSQYLRITNHRVTVRKKRISLTANL